MKRFQKFMYGRYGIDEFYSFLFKVYIVLFILNMFLNLSLISYIEVLLVFYMFFRVFSKNIYKRSNENVIFLGKIEIGLYSTITIYLMGLMIDIIFEGIYFTKLFFETSHFYPFLFEYFDEGAEYSILIDHRPPTK